jgi:hypothetical protein
MSRDPSPPVGRAARKALAPWNVLKGTRVALAAGLLHQALGLRPRVFHLPRDHPVKAHTRGEREGTHAPARDVSNLQATIFNAVSGSRGRHDNPKGEPDAPVPA